MGKKGEYWRTLRDLSFNTFVISSVSLLFGAPWGPEVTEKLRVAVSLFPINKIGKAKALLTPTSYQVSSDQSLDKTLPCVDNAPRDVTCLLEMGETNLLPIFSLWIEIIA